MLGSIACCQGHSILIDKDISSYENLLKQHPELESSTSFYACDLSCFQQRVVLFDLISAQVDSIFCIVNNVSFTSNISMPGWTTSFMEQSYDTWVKVHDVNLHSTFHIIQALHGLLLVNSGSSIINISSIYGFLGPKWSLYEGTSMGNPAAYASSKGALLQFTRWLASTRLKSVLTPSPLVVSFVTNQLVLLIVIPLIPH